MVFSIMVGYLCTALEVGRLATESHVNMMIVFPFLVVIIMIAKVVYKYFKIENILELPAIGQKNCRIQEIRHTSRWGD